MKCFSAFVAIAMCAAVVTACADESYCESRCNEARGDLVRIQQARGGQEVDESSICDTDAIRNADTCAQCEQAFADEFGVESTENQCD